MAARKPRPAPDKARSRVEEFAQSVHASYLSRWQSHDPDALDKMAREAAQEKSQGGRRKRRTSAA